MDNKAFDIIGARRNHEDYCGLTTLLTNFHVPIVKSGNLKLQGPSGPVQVCTGIALPCLNVTACGTCISRVLRRGSATNRLRGLRVRIPPGAFMSCLLCCQVEVSATGRSVVRVSSTVCVPMGVIRCNNNLHLQRVGRRGQTDRKERE